MLTRLYRDYIENYPRRRIRLWVVWYSCSIHLVWGIMMLAGVKVNATPVSDIIQLSSDIRAIGLLLLIVASLAFYGLVNYRYKIHISLWFIAPQQVLVFITAWSSLSAALAGQYADGVARPPEFIFADQLPSIVLAVWHTVAVLDLFIMRGKHE